MNEKITELLKKVRASASVAGEFAAKTANSAGKKANEMFHVSKHNLAIFDLNTEADILYKEIGKIVYRSHQGEDTTAEELSEKLEQLDEKLQQIEELREQIHDLKETKTCANCGTKMEKDAEFCKKCGTKF